MTNVRKMIAGLKCRGAILALVAGLGLLGSFSAASAATITAVASGNGVFAVVASGFTGVAGLDVTVTYDSATLGNPRVEKGAMLGNALFVANPNQTGIIRIGAVSTSGVSGSGTVAVITFDRKGDSAGLLTGITATTINTSGAPLPVTASYSNASSDVAQVVKTETPTQTIVPLSPSGGGTQGTTTTTSGGSLYLGTVTMPGDSVPGQTEKKVETPKSDPQSGQGQGSTTAGPAAEEGKPEPEQKKAPAERKNVVYPSVAERLKASPDNSTMDKVVAAFDLAKDLPYVQTPRIVLSDGTTSVRLTVRLGESKESPSFALEHAKLLSLKQSEDGEWLVEALPGRNTDEAALTVSQGELTVRIPLTVAQPLSEKQLGELKPLSEKSFQLFLKERGTKETPRYDLNGDGKRDYLDDYIYAANYLSLRAASPVSVKPPTPVPVPSPPQKQ